MSPIFGGGEVAGVEANGRVGQRIIIVVFCMGSPALPQLRAFNGAPIQVEVLDDGPVGQIGDAVVGCAFGNGEIGGGGFALGTPAPAGGACGGLISDQTLKVTCGAANDPWGAMA